MAQPQPQPIGGAQEQVQMLVDGRRHLGQNRGGLDIYLERLRERERRENVIIDEMGRALRPGVDFPPFVWGNEGPEMINWLPEPHVYNTNLNLLHQFWENCEIGEGIDPLFAIRAWNLAQYTLKIFAEIIQLATQGEFNAYMLWRAALEWEVSQGNNPDVDLNFLAILQEFPLRVPRPNQAVWGVRENEFNEVEANASQLDFQEFNVDFRHPDEDWEEWNEDLESSTAEEEGGEAPEEFPFLGENLSEDSQRGEPLRAPRAGQPSELFGELLSFEDDSPRSSVGVEVAHSTGESWRQQFWEFFSELPSSAAHN